MRLCSVATLKELRPALRFANGDATLTGLCQQVNEAHYPGLPSATLGWNLPTLSALISNCTSTRDLAVNIHDRVPPTGLLRPRDARAPGNQLEA